MIFGTYTVASISCDDNGRRTSQFMHNGKRRTIRLGKVSQRVADEVKRRIEAIQAASESGVSLDRETAEWVGGIGDALAEKLAAVGLIESPSQSNRRKK